MGGCIAIVVVVVGSFPDVDLLLLAEVLVVEDQECRRCQALRDNDEIAEEQICELLIGVVGVEDFFDERVPEVADEIGDSEEKDDEENGPPFLREVVRPRRLLPILGVYHVQEQAADYAQLYKDEEVAPASDINYGLV